MLVIATGICLPENVEESRILEVNGLMKRGGYKVFLKDVAKDHRIFGSRFVDEWKKEGSPYQFAKSRLVVQAFDDKDHGSVTYFPTVELSSQIPLPAISASLVLMNPASHLIPREITQAYNQSETDVARLVFVKPSKEFGLSSFEVVQLTKPLYGLSEAYTQWFRTCHHFRIEKLGPVPSNHDFCFFLIPKIFNKTVKTGTNRI